MDIGFLDFQNHAGGIVKVAINDDMLIYYCRYFVAHVGNVLFLFSFYKAQALQLIVHITDIKKKKYNLQ